MADFEILIADAVATQEIPSCALVATNRDGSFTYGKAFGSTSMKPENAKPMDLDTVLWIASCTKLMTALCCMQLVDQGHTTLDEPIYTHIPELSSFTVITSFEPGTGKPIEKAHEQPITLRRLLTHSSGLAYDIAHPKLMAWLEYHGEAPRTSGKILERWDLPLVFEPGTGFAYGSGLDYAGLLVERITGVTLEEYMSVHLWAPLGMKDTTFRLSSRPDLQQRLADTSLRTENGKVVFADIKIYLDGNGNEMADCVGGHGCFSTARDYLKILHAVLTCDTPVFCNRELVSEFFAPQLSERSADGLNGALKTQQMNNAVGGMDQGIRKDWGLGGLLLMGDGKDGKKAGTMVWCGLPNLSWWVDRESGVCGLYAGQVLPIGDAKCVSLARKFEEGIYKMIR
ncbi:beta-lactamase/transpeptidase-like protein [Decorospora gaudefroyi]|uniref:Beta-lactamase/transpeptidase-like protein n=1 Tax=Decorospora gaudefroyi TaxID=184978 RepID=A0A6A5KSC4_9PLEO|nr:beta-lactamase/transpeptidase-like protein [Decorospora gaudefroyi]